MPPASNKRRAHIPPLDFHKFVRLARTSRRPSPEAELKQMVSGTDPPLAIRSHSETSRSESETSDGECERTAKMYAALNQYGSIQYDPSSAQFRCWNGHPLHESSVEVYPTGSEGISCDFCGWTEWKDPSSPLPPTRKRNRQDEPPSSAPPSYHFFHCQTCQLDFCSQCCEDVKQDTRYHTPSYRCEGCHSYLNFRDARRHRCRASPSSTPLCRSSSSPLPRNAAKRSVSTTVDNVPPASYWEVSIEASSVDDDVKGVVRSSSLTPLPSESEGTIRLISATRLSAERLCNNVRVAGGVCHITRSEVE